MMTWFHIIMWSIAAISWGRVFHQRWQIRKRRKAQEEQIVQMLFSPNSTFLDADGNRFRTFDEMVRHHFTQAKQAELHNWLKEGF